MGVPGKGRTKGAKDKSPRLPVRPELRCTAVSKQRGDQCRNAAAFGAFVCLSHGAQAPQVLDGARRRIEGLVPIALVRLGQLLESTSDAVALGAARDLLDRIGARVPAALEISGQIDHVVSAPEVGDILARLREHDAISGPSPERRIVEALAASMGLAEDMPYEDRLKAVHDATVPVEGEPLPGWRPRPRAADVDVEDAVVVVPPKPRALPRPAPEPDDTITLTNGERWSAAALSPGGARRAR